MLRIPSKTFLYKPLPSSRFFSIRRQRIQIQVTAIEHPKEVIIDSLKWFGWSVIYNIYNKEALIHVPNPYIVTCVQTLIALLGCLYVITKTFNTNKTSWSYPTILQDIPFLFAATCMSTGQWFGNYFGNLATQEMSYAMVNIVKSSEPLISMMFMYFLYKQSLHYIQTLLIFPIILGIFLCVHGDMTYTHYGALLCILSNVSHVIKTILTKKFLVEKYSLSGNHLFTISMVGSSILCFPMFLAQIEYIKTIHFYGWYSLVISGLSYYLNSVAAFDVMSKVFPVSFSVLNIYKRIVIVFSYYLLHTQFPSLDILFGLLVSNVALYYYLSTKT